MLTVGMQHMPEAVHEVHVWMPRKFCLSSRERKLSTYV
jgi:hypothetical protein